MAPLGKTLVLLGISLVALGAVMWGLSSAPYVGDLPGDISIRRGNFTFYLPLATCILLSILATILFSWMRR